MDMAVQDLQSYVPDLDFSSHDVQETFEKLDLDHFSSIHGEDRNESWFLGADDNPDAAIYKRRPVVMLGILSILLLAVGVGLGVGIALYLAPPAPDPLPPTRAEA